MSFFSRPLLVFRFASLPISLFLVLAAAPHGLAEKAQYSSENRNGSNPRLYSEAVLFGRKAAEAVLARAGAESCLRGKLNRALLGLSASCAAAGERTPLCQLADKAVVVTPMNLAFMDKTARTLLELSE